MPAQLPAPTKPSTDLETQHARITIMRAADPQDQIIQQLIQTLGIHETARLLTRGTRLTPAHIDQVLEHTGENSDAYLSRISERITRWSNRATQSDPAQELNFATKIGAWLCTPEDPDWPSSLKDFGYKEPYGLWGRGDRARLHQYRESRSLAVVGSRDISTYGQSATQHIVGELAQAGLTIVSGGAFGIDAVAHASALTAGTLQLPTIAFMAGGVDRLYPKHNEKLLKQVMCQGLIFSEVPMGQTPTRWRFLQRNRLIAEISRATIIVEARWRSGALNTAHHALELGRTVYALPGSIFSPSSEGCHRLIHDGLGTLLSDPKHLIEELAHTNVEQTSAFAIEEIENPADHLTTTEQIIWDALPVRRTMALEELCTISGIDARTAMLTLSRLSTKAIAVQDSSNLQWKKKIPHAR